jgi:hypothetical protein
MATYTKFNQFVEDVHHKVHDLTASTGDTLSVALCAAANAPVATNTVLANLTTVSLANLSGDANLTISTSAQTSGTFKLTVSDKTLTASGGTIGPLRYVVIYNNTPTSPADPLIAWYDYGSEITLADGESLNIDFDDTNGLFQVA